MTKQTVPASATDKQAKPATPATGAPRKARVSNSSQPGLQSKTKAGGATPATKKSGAKGAKA